MWFYVVKDPRAERPYVLSAHRMLRQAVAKFDSYEASVGAVIRRGRPSCRRLYPGEHVDLATFQMDTENVIAADIERARNACRIKRNARAYLDD